MSNMDYYKELINCNKKIYLIKQIVDTKQRNFNIERITTLKSLKNNLVYNSILKNLEILDSKETRFKNLIAEVLIWSEVSKTGTKEEISKWKAKGYNLFIHNIASAEIYKDNTSKFNLKVYVLIKTHGLIGQYIKGEVALNTNKELYSLIENSLLKKEELREILLILNECIIKEVSESLYDSIKDKIYNVIDRIINNDMQEEINIPNRLIALNKSFDENSINKINELIKDLRIYDGLDKVFSNTRLWYYYSALNEFDVEEQIKILLIISNYLENVFDVSFFKLMKFIYLDYDNIKRINLFKLKIIQKYLSTINYEDILNSNIKDNQNITYTINKNNGVLEFNFEFSEVAQKLIEYCQATYAVNDEYNKSATLIYNLFGFKRTKNDKFYNEIDYLQSINNNINEKSKMFEFIVGTKVLNVGYDDTAFIDLIMDTYPDKKVQTISISNDFTNGLKRKKVKENILYLDKYYQKGSMDTIIFSSIIHELYSHIEFNNKKFNQETIIQALKSAYNLLKPKGRIIIRDGIMTDKFVNRIIEFKNKEDIKILERFQKDFKGREINYKKLNETQVLMPINDAMEFLYTYTWGEKSYSLEVQEQFGYFTPKEYEKIILDSLPKSNILYSRAFLQNGYSNHLEHKINFYDENYNTVDLPNSTYILVVEKND